MTRRQSFFAYAALCIGVITFASSFARPTIGQAPVAGGAEAKPQIGRYQIAVTSIPGLEKLL